MSKEDKTELFEVKTTAKIEFDRVKDLLCNALEGGSNYWYNIVRYDLVNDVTKEDMEFPHLDAPFYNGCGIIFEATDCSDDPDLTGKRLDCESMQKGLQLMADKYPHHFDNFVTQNDDAETGDVFLQCCLFDKVVFG